MVVGWYKLVDMALYTVLMYNFNNYEILREPEELDSDAEYIYVTDDTTLRSDKWKIVIDDSLNGLSAFEKCYKVRFNLFKYASSPVCIYVDGSIQIHKSLRPLYDAFIQSNADLGLNIHPDRATMDEEYAAWILTRNYPIYQKNKCYAMFSAAHYDTTYAGLYQGTARICRNTQLNSKIDHATFALLKQLGTNGIIERLDQTIYSFVINKFFPNVTIFPFSHQCFQSAYMTWMYHNTSTPTPPNNGRYISKGFVKGALQTLFRLD